MNLAIKQANYLHGKLKKEDSEKYIHSIKTEDCICLEDPKDINLEFKKYYQALYKSDFDNKNINTEIENFLDGLPIPKINTVDKDLLDAGISEEEVLGAINSLQNNKAPGPDGFPIEYFKVFAKKLLSPLTNMIREALDNQVLPHSLEVATITLLLKPGKDQQECGSYRPLSLLNSDYKVLSKLIALRLENVIPKIIHSDQTGFIKNRQGADNVRRLFHVIDAAQKREHPMMIVSMDAEKAFDRIEPNFLTCTLRAMNFGDTFIQYIKTLFNDPKAQIVTNGVLSDAFSLSRGCRQGCPSSPGLFAIAMEPLAIAIRSDPSITGILFGIEEHKLCLYADDLLLFLTNPINYFPPLFQCLKEYSAVSGYKLNYSKSEAFPINIPDNDIGILSGSLKWCPSGFKYLGINISGSFNKVYHDNYVKLLNQTKTDLQRWMDLPLSLIGRINTIKMNILPKFIYLFHSIPFKIPKYFFKDLNKAISTFLWNKKTPRVNLTTLQAPYVKGGLNLPNFRIYYLASQFRPLWIWLHPRNSDVRWVSIEQHEMKATPVTVIPFLGTRKKLSVITKNPVLLDNFDAWQESHRLLGLNTSLLVNTPLDGNPNIPSPIVDKTIQSWIKKGIKTIGDLYVNGIFASFIQLSELFDLPKHNLFKYLQIRHWIKSQTFESFPNIPEKSPIEDRLLDIRHTSTKSLTSSIYRILINDLPAYQRFSTKQKWESDLVCSYNDWCTLLEKSQTVLVSTKHRQIQYNILHRTYYTPYRLNKFNGGISAICQRCNISTGTLLHMLWSCPALETFWKYVIATTSEISKNHIDPDPKIWVLGDISSLRMTYHEGYFILLASTAAKKCILKNWKSENPPERKHWINELVSYSTPEKILYSVRKKPTDFDYIWAPFLDALPLLGFND